MKKPKKETTRQYFIAVLELDDAVPAEAETPEPARNEKSCATLTSSLRRFISVGRRSTVGHTAESFAPGMTCRTTPATPKARQQSWSANDPALLRKGFTVNSHTEVRRLYVINLNNPDKTDVGAGYVYVGETSHPLEKRLQQHLTGESEKGKDLSSNVVNKYGVDLNLDLTPASTYLTKKQAQKAERRLADRLRAEGYCVEGGH